MIALINIKKKWLILGVIFVLCLCVLSSNNALATNLEARSPSVGDTHRQEGVITLHFSTVDNPIVIPIKKIIQQAYNRIGEYQINAQVLPSKRSVQQANLGKYFDGELARVVVDSVAYPDLIKVEPAIIAMDVVLVSKRLIDPLNKELLDTLRVGFVRGRFGVIPHVEQLKNASSEKNATVLLKQLMAGRLDAIIIDSSEAKKIIERYGFQGVIVNSPPLSRLNIYHYLHKKHKALVDPISKAIQSMLDDGSIDKILQLK